MIIKRRRRFPHENIIQPVLLPNSSNFTMEKEATHSSHLSLLLCVTVNCDYLYYYTTLPAKLDGLVGEQGCPFKWYNQVAMKKVIVYTQSKQFRSEMDEGRQDMKGDRLADGWLDIVRIDQPKFVFEIRRDTNVHNLMTRLS